MSTSNSMFQPTPQAFMNHWRHKDVGDTPFFINFQNSLNNPRDEGFFDMLTYTCLPTFKLKSMAFTLIMLNTLYYVISLLYGDVQIGGKLLEPTQNSLFSLGMLYSYFIKYQLEYQRFFLSLLLYNNFVNYCTCQFALAVYGSYVEKLLGWKKLWMIGLVGGCGGTLLSSCYSSQAHINGSCVAAAYIGVLFGYTCLKWDQWNYAGSGRWQMLSWIALGVGVLTWQSLNWVLIDGIGNMGSFFVGMVLSISYIGILQRKRIINVLLLQQSYYYLYILLDYSYISSGIPTQQSCKFEIQQQLMFEQNRQKIAQTHEIINQIDAQLNDYLAQKGLTSLHQSERVQHIEHLIQQNESKNKQLRLTNQQIQQQTNQINAQIQQLKQDFHERLYQKLQQQQDQLQTQFETHVTQFGEKAKNKLLSTLQLEDQYRQQYNLIQNDKALMQRQLEQIQNQNTNMYQEKNELEGSYQSLMQMHNQLVHVDMAANESNHNNKSQVINILNNYKAELEQLKNANETIQRQMNQELDGLKMELQKQRNENESLVQKVQQSRTEQQLNDVLYERVFNNNKQPQIRSDLTPIKQNRKKPKKSKNVTISKSKLEHFEKELKRLQEIVNSKIEQKKQQQQ